MIGEVNNFYKDASTKPFTVAQAKSKEVIVSFQQTNIDSLNIEMAI